MSRYSRVLFVAVVFWLALAAAFNLAVDPYDQIGWVRKAGFNEIKSRASQQGELMRRHLVSTVKPRAIIVGNSRAEVGFDPANAAWGKDLQPVVNGAVPGSGPGTARRMAAHAMSMGTVHVIVAGVDFVDFLVADASDEKVLRDFRQSLPVRWDVRFKERFNALLSISALYDSFATVLSQGDAFSPRVERNGFNPMRDYERLASTEGYGDLFMQRDRENAVRYLRGGKSVVPPSGGTSEAFLELRGLINMAASRDVDVHLVIYPYHAHILELFRLTGLWTAFEQWKRELVALAESSSSRRIKVWDFSGYGSFAAEAVPRRDDLRATVKWYWEAGHFKKELGDIVLSRVLGGAGVPDDNAFGVLLTRENLDGHLEAIGIAGKRYRNERSDEVRGLVELVGNLGRAAPAP